MKPSEYLRLRAQAAFHGIETPSFVLSPAAWEYVELIVPTMQDAAHFERQHYRHKDEGRAMRLLLAASIAESEGQ